MAFRKTSVLAAFGAVAVMSAGAAMSASAVPTTSTAVAATCHASSGNLYCGNRVNAAIC
ncbi:hypothetical protein [Kribbella koreensis]|uniref:hypothetical protein n=1 Tax=Kribbella koreensis TaxID=57909 RepID=UPI0031DA932C